MIVQEENIKQKYFDWMLNELLFHQVPFNDAGNGPLAVKPVDEIFDKKRCSTAGSYSLLHGGSLRAGV